MISWLVVLFVFVLALLGPLVPLAARAKTFLELFQSALFSNTYLSEGLTYCMYDMVHQVQYWVQ